MTIYEFCDYAVNMFETVKVYSLSDKKIIFTGSYYKLMENDELAMKIVSSFEVEDGIVIINVMEV